MADDDHVFAVIPSRSGCPGTAGRIDTEADTHYVLRRGRDGGWDLFKTTQDGRESLYLGNSRKFRE